MSKSSLTPPVRPVELHPVGPVKLLLVGDECAGKTSLLWRYCDIGGIPNICEIGVDLKIKHIELEGTTIKTVVWMGGSPPNYFNIQYTYVRGANGLIIVYDVNGSLSMAREWIEKIALVNDCYCLFCS